MEILGMLVVWFLIGLIPALVARNKGRSFVAWWVFGFALFIAAMPASLLVSDKTKKCPHCRASIDETAKVCRHCGRDVFPAATAEMAALAWTSARRPVRGAHVAGDPYQDFTDERRSRAALATLAEERRRPAFWWQSSAGKTGRRTPIFRLRPLPPSPPPAACRRAAWSWLERWRGPLGATNKCLARSNKSRTTGLSDYSWAKNELNEWPKGVTMSEPRKLIPEEILTFGKKLKAIRKKVELMMRNGTPKTERVKFVESEIRKLAQKYLPQYRNMNWHAR
jgi:hypothetical protein